MSDEPERPHLETTGGLRRRDFLALAPTTAAVAAVAAVWPGAALADTSPLGCDLTKADALSVGFIAGSEEWVEALDLPWQRADLERPREFEIEVVPATRLTVGSDLALRTLELTVHGLVPGVPAAGTASWKTAYLFASVPAPPDLPFGPDPVPFLAWSARADGDPRQAAKVRPILETGVDGSLYVGLEIRSGVSRAKRGSALEFRSANFTVDEIADRPKLQAGVYLLAFAPGLWRRSWRGNVFDLADQPGLESVAIGVLPL